MAPHTVLLWSLLASLEWCQASATTAVATKGPLTAALFPGIRCAAYLDGLSWLGHDQARGQGDWRGGRTADDPRPADPCQQCQESRRADGKGVCCPRTDQGPMGERPDYAKDFLCQGKAALHASHGKAGEGSSGGSRGPICCESACAAGHRGGAGYQLLEGVVQRAMEEASVTPTRPTAALPRTPHAGRQVEVASSPSGPQAVADPYLVPGGARPVASLAA